MPRVTSQDGTNIHYDITGDGARAAVLIQGLGLSSRHWADQPGVVAQAGFRVLTPDNRGTGRSDRTERFYSIADMANDVVAAMDDAGVREAAIVGISMGGMIAQEVALRYPERVSALVLLATTAGLPHGVLPRPRAISLLGRVPYFHARGEPERAYRHLFFGARTDAEAAPLLQKIHANWGSLPETERATGLHFARQLGAAARHSTGFRLKAIDVPTHIVAGEGDTLIPPRNTAVLGRLIRGSSVELLPKVGHAIPVECPDVIAESLCRLAR